MKSTAIRFNSVKKPVEKTYHNIKIQTQKQKKPGIKFIVSKDFEEILVKYYAEITLFQIYVTHKVWKLKKQGKHAKFITLCRSMRFYILLKIYIG